MPKTITPALLAIRSKTIAYEFRCLIGTADALRQKLARGHAVIHNSLVETFSNHFRLLTGFFFYHVPGFTPPRPDDIIAGDYYSSWPAKCPAPSATLKSWKNKASKEVMHLTTERDDLNMIPGKTSDWPIDALEAEIILTLHEFLANTSASDFDLVARAELNTIASVSTGPMMMALHTCVRTMSPYPSFCATTSS